MSESRYGVLDGWRGISILFVLLGHLFPLGPKAWQLNGAIASSGMAIFFILSGFLITNLLLRNQNIQYFLIRRFLRIIPLAWLITIISLLAFGANQQLFFPHLFFYANWKPIALTGYTGHLWSLCVEMQFYVVIAIMVKFFKQKAFYILVLLLVSITAFKFVNDVQITVATYHRVDEILAGMLLALINNRGKAQLKETIGRLPIFVLFILLLISTHPSAGSIGFLRPYIAMLMIGSTIFTTQEKWYSQYLSCKFLVYLASTSYALYMLHGVLSYTWLGQGDLLAKYSKRPLLLAVTFILAHISTFHYEKYWINLGKNLTKSS